MKKLFMLLFGVLLFAGSFAGPPISEVDFDTGVYIEQPSDFVTVENIDVTILNVDFVMETPNLEGWTDDYSLNVNRYEYLFYEANEAFDYKFYEQKNYFYREIERLNRPPNTEAKTLLSSNNYSNVNDGFIKAIDKNILFGFWLC